ncbi:hypothetical protein OROMI_022923 [Orobanche minor]
MMKRSRYDCVSPQVKRPAISPRVEPSGQVQMSTASSAQRLTTTDALSYLKNVKEIFQDKRDKYDDFLDVMKDFKAQRIDTSGVILKVKELFKGYRDLILGFNTFLPKGFEISLPPEDEPFLRKKPVEFEEAMSFVNKIKTRFQGDDHVYKAFLDILNMYRKENKSITEVYQEVSVLFQNHADLLVEFTHFLPDTSGAASVQYTQPGRNHIKHGDDRGSPMTIARPLNVEKKPAVSYAVCDHNISHPDLEKWSHVEKQKAKKEDRDKNVWEHDDSLDHKRNSARRNAYATYHFHRGIDESELAFCEKVRERLQPPENYMKFSDCICSYKSKYVAAAQFRKLMDSLIGSHPDLMEACEAFMTYVEKSGSLRNIKQVHIPLKVNEDGDDPDREDRDKTKDHDDRERDRHDRGLAFNSKDVPGQRVSYACKEKFMAKPIHELDLSDCESCTPSYRLLPDNYPIPAASCRTEIGNQVLNDHWVSVTSGSEDYSFKHMRKNQYEESLFRCEDDRFELDMLLESVNATVKRVEELLDRMNAYTNKPDSSFCIEEYLTALSLRCIERLYGDHGLDVMDVLRKNAPLALPVILIRLKQKQEEWARCRADFSKVWAEIYAKNYHKSLDHRSFYFKQQDTKILSAKALLAEIKEMGEKNQNEDDMALLSIAAGYKQPIKPDMVFEFPDPDIQEDLYQLMRYSCGEVCTPEQREKVMKIWTTFLEEVLGVPSRPPSTEDEEDAVRASTLIADSSDNVANNGDELCYAPENGQVGANMMSAKSLVSKQGGFLEGGTSNSAGVVKNIDEENVSATSNEDGVITKPTSTSMVPEDVKTKKHHEKTRASSTNEREEGELSPSKNLEEMCIEQAPEETNAIAEDGEESVQGSSDSENASEKGDVSASESANGEECSPEEPDDDENDNKDDESEGEVDVCENDWTVQLSDHFLRTVKPLAIKVPTGKEENFQIFYGNDSFYLLFRLHQSIFLPSESSRIKFAILANSRAKCKNYIEVLLNDKMLYGRMLSAKLHSSSYENRWRISNGANQTDSYARFKDALCSLLNGSSDNAKFEDECRAIIGAQSYVLFTLDKLIHKLVKQLQTIASDEVDNKLLQLYAYERLKNPTAFSDEVYRVNARFLLPDDNLYRIECLPRPTRLTIQMMRNEHDKFEPSSVSMDPNFAAYLNDELLAFVPERMGNPGVYLKRNKRKLYYGHESSDFDKAMEGLIVHNGMEMKVNSVTKKVAYVLDTEDFLYRTKTRRQVLYHIRHCAGTSNGISQSVKRHKLLFS